MGRNKVDGKKFRFPKGALMSQRTIRNNQGAAVVELAITLPILLVVLFGIFEFGLIMYNKAVITNASREGARTGIVFKADASSGNYDPYTKNEIRGVVDAYLDNGKRLIPPLVPPAVLDFHVYLNGVEDMVCTGPTTIPRPTLRVVVGYDYNFFILPRFVTSIIPLHLVGETNMRCE